MSEQSISVLPKNFDQLPAKKQSQIIVSVAKEQLLDAVKMDIEIKEAKEKVKLLQMKINASAQMKELKALKKQLKDVTKQHEAILMQFAGMLKLAKKLGLDLEKELKEFKVLELGNGQERNS